MGQALYRQYRPKSLEDVTGQEHITSTLKKAIDKNQISHAYLLTGPRGVGKTTVARILAHLVNDLPYDDDSAHLDIIEIDAASNRRIDEIRELRERVYVSPSELKYKVYIIDEVHMLTREAFNALLKTLEEPPAHVIFILATTDTHKLPDTIISRTQRYSFKPIKEQDASMRLAAIAKKEKIKISPEALELLASHGDGSLRDSISLLDQVKNHADQVTAESVRQLLGLPEDTAIDDLLDATLKSNDAAALIKDLDKLFDAGFQAGVIAKILSSKLRQELVKPKASLDSSIVLSLLADLIDVPASIEPERYLEIVLLKAQPIKKAALEEDVKVKDEKPEVVREDTTTKEESKVVMETEEIEIEIEAALKPKLESTEAVSSTSKQLLTSSDAELWQEVLKSIKSKYNTLYGILRMAEPEFKDDTITLAFAFAFHEKRIKETANKQTIEKTITDLSGRKLIIECVINKNAKPSSTELPPDTTVAKNINPQNNDSLSTISSIFNGAELLES
jgi:DNA polymerase-3 subunit gamma/tau